MNQPDLSLTNVYCPILQQQSKFRAKVTYALRCICDSISRTNQNQSANLQYLASYIQSLILVCKQHPDITVMEPIIQIFNYLRPIGLIDESQIIMKIARSQIYTNVTDSFIHQSCKLIDKCRFDSQQSAQFAYDLLQKYGKHINKNQLNYLTSFIQRYYTHFSAESNMHLISIEKLSARNLLQIVYEQLITKNIPKGDAIKILDKCVDKYVGDYYAIYMALYLAMMIQENSGKDLQPKFLDVFFKSKYKPLYLPSNTIISSQSQSQLSPTLIQKYGDIILRYISIQCSTRLSLTQTKNINDPQFLILTQLLQKSQISPNLQNKYPSIIPISLLSTPQSILQKLQYQQDPNNALKALLTYKNQQSPSSVPKLTHLNICLASHHIFLNNKQHISLAHTIKNLLFSHKVTKQDLLLQILNKNGKYLPLLPIYGEEVSDKSKLRKLQGIFNKEIEKYVDKCYICFWAVKCRNLEIVQSFIGYFFREIKSQWKIVDQILYYMKKRQLGQSDLQWLAEHFSDDLQRIFQVILTMLENSSSNAPTNIIFQLQKLEACPIFCQWHTIYRWALNPLMNPNFEETDKILDHLQAFETLIEEHCSVPIKIIQISIDISIEYCEIIIQHWQKYTHSHIFSIQRTLSYLYQGILNNQQSIEQLILALSKLKHKKQTYNQFDLSSLALRTLLDYALDQDSPKDQADLDSEIKKYLSVTDLNVLTGLKQKQKHKQLQYIKALQLFMWRFQYSDDTIDKKIQQNIFNIITNRQSLKNKFKSNYPTLLTNCLQITATMNHSGNLLTIPIKNLLIQFKNNKKIITNCLDIVQSVASSNPKALIKYQLQAYIGLCLIDLITTNNVQIELLLIDILDRLCMTQGSPYRPGNKVGKDYYQKYLLEVLYSQKCLEKCRYRPKLIQFVLMMLVQCEYREADSYRRQFQWIVDKYCQEEEIIKICQKFGFKSKIENSMPKLQLWKDKKQQQPKAQQLTTESSKQAKQSINIQPIQSIQSIQVKKLASTKNLSLTKLIVDTEPIIPPPTPKKLKSQRPSNQQLKTVKQSQVKIIKQQQKYHTKSPETNRQNLQDASPTKKQTWQEKRQKQSPVRRNKTKLLETNQHISNIKEHNCFYEGILMKIKSKQNIPPIMKKKFKESLLILLETVTKKLSILEQHQKYSKQIIILINLRHLTISQHKQRNLSAFIDRQILQFFNEILQNSLNSPKINNEHNSTIIQIIKNTWSLSTAKKYSQSGIWSKLIQMIKIKINQYRILTLFASIQIPYQLLNQFYERKLLDDLTQSLENLNKSKQQKLQLCLWTRLAGKICTNQILRSIVQKINIHELVWKNISVYKQVNKVSDLAYFYSHFLHSNNKLSDWCIDKQIPKTILFQMPQQLHKNKECHQFYNFYKTLSQNGQKYIQHLFNIGYHKLMLRILRENVEQADSSSNKHFYKSLALLFTPNQYRMFLKQQVFLMLMRNYDLNHSVFTMEACLKFITCLQKEQQCMQIMEQGFQETSNVFDTKMRDDQSYSSVLQMYMILLKKFGNFSPEFFNLAFIYRILRKAVYSINVPGKNSVIQFFICISNIDKVYYGNANFVRVFESVMNYQTSEKQLKLLLDYLIIENSYPKPTRSSQLEEQRQAERYPLRFQNMVEITDNPLLQILFNSLFENRQDKNQKNEKKQLINALIIGVLDYFSRQQIHSLRIYNKIGEQLQNVNENSNFSFEKKIYFMMNIIKSKSVQRLIELNSTEYYKFLIDSLESPQVNQQAKEAKYNLNKIIKITTEAKILNNQQLLGLLKIISKKQFIQSKQIKIIQALTDKSNQTNDIEHGIRNVMTAGAKVKMYKEDGSISDLIFFITQNLQEINCAIRIGDPVKQKWRLKISEVSSIKQYDKSQEYNQSIFASSQGIFSKAPDPCRCLSIFAEHNRLHACFQSESAKKQWVQYLQTLIIFVNAPK